MWKSNQHNHLEEEQAHLTLYLQMKYLRFSNCASREVTGSVNKLKNMQRNFPGGTVVKNLPANAEDTS